MSLTWDQEFGARFKTLSDRDVEIWQEIISNEIRNLRPGDVLAAVRLLGEEKRAGKHKYAPTVEDVISAIIKNRWRDRISRDGMGPQRAGCALCGGMGWIPFGASINHKTNAMRIGAEKHLEGGTEWGLYTMSVPCLCSLGARGLKAYPEADREKIAGLVHRVMGWKKTLTADSMAEDQRFTVDEG